MQTVHDIEKSIEQEWAKFQHSPWPGSIPKDVIVNFKKCLLEAPPMKHQIHVKVIKDILAKEKSTEKLTYVELGLAINLILNSPLFVLSDDLDAALVKLERIEKMRIEYNNSAKEKETQLIQKKQTLIQLATGGGGNGKLHSLKN